MRLLSSEAKDWKSREVTEAEEVLCRESAQAAQQATEAQEAMDQHYKAKWRQAEADLKALCQSNSARAQSLAIKLQETNLEHHELYTAQERQLQLEAQALRQAQEPEQQAAQMTQEHELAIQEFRRQAEEQPELHKVLWRCQLSQQSTYKAEIHELHTESEMLNMREVWDAVAFVNTHVQAWTLHSKSKRRIWTRQCSQHSISRLMFIMDSTQRNGDSRQTNIFRSAVTDGCPSAAWSKSTDQEYAPS